jgi:hypothetical protein
MLTPAQVPAPSSTPPLKWGAFLKSFTSSTRSVDMSRKAQTSVARAKTIPEKIEECSEATPMTIAESFLVSIQSLGDDWDGEGAPRPSGRALENARQIMLATLGQSLTPSLVTADVLGGVAIGFDSVSYTGERPRRSAWIACMNSGSISIVLRDRANGAKPRGEAFSASSAGALADFINGTK